MPVQGHKAASLAMALLGLATMNADAAENLHRVVMKAADFAPKQVTVHVGDVVEWDNQDIVAHTATAAGKSWDVSLMPGRNGRLVMQVPGTLSYICRYHPNMKGEIVVEP